VPDTHDTLTEARPRVVLNRPLVVKLLTELDLHSSRDRAEFLGTSVSVTNRMLREPNEDHPEEHAVSADTIAAVCHAFQYRHLGFSDLFHITGGHE
jgi:hypothetical protein